VGATVQASTQEHVNRYGPTRIEVTTGSEQDLVGIAESLGVRYQHQPAAEALAHPWNGLQSPTSTGSGEISTLTSSAWFMPPPVAHGKAT
jgi:hypothetical protein